MPYKKVHKFTSLADTDTANHGRSRLSGASYPHPAIKGTAIIIHPSINIPVRRVKKISLGLYRTLSSVFEISWMFYLLFCFFVVGLPIQFNCYFGRGSFVGGCINPCIIAQAGGPGLQNFYDEGRVGQAKFVHFLFLAWRLIKGFRSETSRWAFCSNKNGLQIFMNFFGRFLLHPFFDLFVFTFFIFLAKAAELFTLPTPSLSQ